MSYVWVDVDNWISTWELKVTDTAEDLAKRYLELGDPDNAVWAARRGLNTCQTHARLTQLLAQAHLAGGDRMAAERVLQSHRAALEKLELDDDVGDLGDTSDGLSRRHAVATLTAAEALAEWLGDAGLGACADRRAKARSRSWSGCRQGAHNPRV